MPIYLETQITPNQEQQKFLDFVMSNGFPWYYTRTTLKYKMFSHVLMKRADIDKVAGVINSPYYKNFENIFLDVCEQNKIKVKTIFRANVNNTAHQLEKYGEIHTDHDFPHNQFIWYLNDFTDAPTYIFDKKDKLIKTTAVGKNKINIFSKCPHAQGFCAPEETRIVVVFTFS